ncbi:NDR1/HIN1-like protein 6 [Carica papaya]|uniref:NDR1/HIN1-like protein 6 n=1 Tax=Carica papaya TaxID=3649 RepID=UPI000B8C936B|nr:NDR1/HIN1-like protein 6 [Carica papaya]
MEAGYSYPQPPRYEMLNKEQYPNLRPPPGHRHNIPRYNDDHSRKSSKLCLRCICCLYCCLLTIVIISFLLILIVYAIYSPQIPNYELENLKVNTFEVRSDRSFSAEFLVSIKAANPNAHIGFHYGKDSSVVVEYLDKSLCSGKLPSFFQPGRNTSIANVLLKGRSEFDLDLQQTLSKNRNSGKIPLVVKLKVPVSIVLGDFLLRQVVILVNCSMVINNLSANQPVKILSSGYSYTFAF